MQKTFSFIKSQLSQGFRVMLMTVIGREGSSPGKQGFMMAVASNDRFTGSIGGGVMEHRLTEQAKRLLKKKELPSPFLLFQDHDPEAAENRSGMICSGGQTIAFHPLTPNDLPVVSAVTEFMEKEKKGVLSLTEKGFFFHPGMEMTTAMESNVQSGKKWEFRRQVGMPDTLYIFGGGHVGLALSKIFRLLDFKICLFDNRSGLNTFEENRFAHVKRIVDYREAASLVPEGFHVYVVIVTFAHKSDEQVLAQMLDKKLKYLGLMGSAKKIETIFGRLRERGFDPERLAAVHAPIGLPVNSETPEEIAVSIAAEIIAVKNGKPA
jgi:xanthine dehydrogenase accessory factor